MKLFSKIVFICNVSFLIMMLMRFIELSNKTTRGTDHILPLNFLTGTLVILGQLSIFINLVFCLITGGMLISKRPFNLPRWLVIFNFALLIIQFFFFLFT